MKKTGIVNIILFCRQTAPKTFSKMNPYNLKRMNQDKLVEELCAQFEQTILQPLHRDQKDTMQSSLENQLNDLLKRTRGLFDSLIEEKLMKRHNTLLERRGFSALSAIVEAHDPERVKPIFENIVRAENASRYGEESKTSELSWQDYFDFAYGEFWKDFKKLLPEGPHAEFYMKRVSQKNKQQPGTQNKQKQEQGRDDSSKDAAKSPSPQKKNEQLRSNLSKPLENNEKEGPPKSNEEKEDQSSVQQKQSRSPSPAPRPKLKSGRPEVMKTDANIPVPVHDSLNSSEREQLLPREKNTELPNNAPTGEPEAAEVVGPVKPDPPKPKKNLLEQMQELSKSKIEKTTEKEKKIPYPPIFKRKSWKKYWSNSESVKGSEWNQFFWNCNSIGKSYLMKAKERVKLQREYDVNQDFAVVNPGRDSLRTILFDGVSQSRAPRQWAECLAETYIENKLNVSKLKSHSKYLEEWHRASRKKWDTWIEEHYLPQRQHLPDWRLKNEKNLSFTTFLTIEIDNKFVRIANIGDSAVFCKFKSGAIRHLPTTYNHLLRPKNISTLDLYKPDEIEFYEFKVDSLESLLACTDSIADYISDENEKSMSDKYDECLRELSTKGDKFEFISRMIAKGPSKGGWLEDDVTFFSLVQSGSDTLVDEPVEKTQTNNYDNGRESE